MTKALEINYSHGRPRVELRRPSDGGTPALPEAVDAAPTHDATTGRFLPGNRAHRLRALKSKQAGIATLDPARCASWLAPSVKDGAGYAMTLMSRFPDPALARLVGATADAHVMARALLQLAATGDKDALSEARAWLREHRACLRELAALAGLVTREAPGDPYAEIAAAHARDAAERANR